MKKSSSLSNRFTTLSTTTPKATHFKHFGFALSRRVPWRAFVGSTLSRSKTRSSSFSVGSCTATWSIGFIQLIEIAVCKQRANFINETSPYRKQNVLKGCFFSKSSEWSCKEDAVTCWFECSNAGHDHITFNYKYGSQLEETKAQAECSDRMP